MTLLRCRSIFSNGKTNNIELDNFDNYVPNISNIELDFNANVTISKKNKKKAKQVESEEESTDEDIEIIEAFLAKKFTRG